MFNLFGMQGNLHFGRKGILLARHSATGSVTKPSMALDAIHLAFYDTGRSCNNSNSNLQIHTGFEIQYLSLVDLFLRFFGLLCMLGRLFTTPCCAFRLGRLMYMSFYVCIVRMCAYGFLLFTLLSLSL